MFEQSPLFRAIEVVMIIVFLVALALACGS